MFNGCSRIRNWGFLLVFVFVVSVLLVSCEGKPKPQKCEFCNMMVNLPDDRQGAKIELGNGETLYYCTMAHAVKGLELEEKTATDLKIKLLVVDYDSWRFIDAEKAFYIMGGDVRPSMPGLKKSVVAFFTADAAQGFKRKHKGLEMSLYGLRTAALEPPKTK